MDIVLFSDMTTSGIGRYAGVYRVATELRKSGYTVQVIDFFTSMSIDKISTLIKKFVTDKTLWCGFSMTFLYVAEHGSYRLGYHKLNQIFSLIKDTNPKCRIVIGGSSASTKTITEYPLIDHSIEGLADVSAIEFTRMLVNGEDLPQLIAEQNFNQNDFDFINSRIEYVKNDCIFPGENLPIEIARGCIFKCAFCQHNLLGKKQWEFVRDPELVVEDILEYNSLYGSKGFIFCDDTYNDSTDKVQKFHEHFSKLPFDFSFSSYIRLDLLISNWFTLDLLYESGLRSAFFGIESLNHQSAKIVGKGMETNKIIDSLYAIKDKYPMLHLTGSFIAGLPYETPEMIENTFEWLMEDDNPLDDVTVYSLDIGRTGSLFSYNPKKYGYEVDMDSNNWVSEWMTKDIAIQLAKNWDKTRYSRPNFSQGSWCYYHRFGNLDIDFKQKIYSQNELKAAKYRKVAEYYNRLKNL